MAIKQYTPTSISVQLGFLIHKNSYGIQAILEPFRPYIVYVVRDRYDVLYVGSSVYSARDRIRLHMYDLKSPIGQYIKANKPASLNWFVEIYKYKNQSSIRAIEKIFIKQLHPLLNKRIPE